ncbi:DUF6850 family outer membrane beta-barrel protein [Formosa undariae]|uniref:DUF6850 family outer membrane beta-barrel protein n=1 Tax=Formosa undariae TaxID=1325436 RepID=A0ABV5EZ89_9FLAO
MFFTFSLFLVVLHASSQTITNVNSLSVIERDFQFQIFENRYFDIPSLINQANLQKFSYGQANYLYSEGELRHPQDYKKQNGLYVETASLSAVQNTNWTLYGSLEYLNTRLEDVENNLTYGITEYNSPYYFFQETNGVWNHQDYNFEASAANKINSKLTLGGYLNYDTNFYFRKTDTRNELTALKILTKLSLSYQLNPEHILSVAISNEFFKTDSELGNKFPENNTATTANYYLNTGLGSYIKNIDNGFQTKRNIPELQFSWITRKSDWDLSVSSDTKYGLERWIDKNIVNLGENDELTKYSFLKESVKVFYNKYKDNSLLSLYLKAEYLKGNGKVWEDSGAYYYKNFTTTSYLVNAEANMLFYNKLLNKISLGLNYYNKSQLDLNYAYVFDYQYLDPKIEIGLNKRISNKTAVFATIETAYHMVLNVEHDPFAANNIYVDWIGNKVANYTGVDAFNFNTKLGFDLKLKNENKLECSLTTDYTKATQLPEDSVNYYSKNDDYLSLVAGLKLYF